MTVEEGDYVVFVLSRVFLVLLCYQMIVLNHLARLTVS